MPRCGQGSSAISQRRGLSPSLRSVSGVVALIIGVLAFGAGAAATVLFAPPLAGTSVGVLAGVVVAVLAGAALAVLAVQIYATIDVLGVTAGNEGQVVASGVTGALSNAGTLAGLAAAVYLLAPAPE